MVAENFEALLFERQIHSLNIEWIAVVVCRLICLRVESTLAKMSNPHVEFLFKPKWSPTILFCCRCRCLCLTADATFPLLFLPVKYSEPQTNRKSSCFAIRNLRNNFATIQNELPTISFSTKQLWFMAAPLICLELNVRGCNSHEHRINFNRQQQPQHFWKLSTILLCLNSLARWYHYPPRPLLSVLSAPYVRYVPAMASISGIGCKWKLLCNQMEPNKEWKKRKSLRPNDEWKNTANIPRKKEDKAMSKYDRFQSLVSVNVWNNRKRSPSHRKHTHAHTHPPTHLEIPLRNGNDRGFTIHHWNTKKKKKKNEMFFHRKWHQMWFFFNARSPSMATLITTVFRKFNFSTIVASFWSEQS